MTRQYSHLTGGNFGKAKHWKGEALERRNGGKAKCWKGLTSKDHRQENPVMSLDFIKQHTATKQASIEFLKLHQVIRRLPPHCMDCNRDMTFVKRSRQQSGYVWHCPIRRCGNNESPLVGSFFEKTKLAPGKVIEIMWCWANQMPNKTAGNLVNFELKIFREILMNNKSAPTIF